MALFEGYIRSWFPERGFGFIRNHTTKADFWFHLTKCSIPADKMMVGANVRFSLGEYVKKGQTRIQAINIELSLPLPEHEYVESAPVVKHEPVITPEPKPVRAEQPFTPSAALPTATRSLAFNHARDSKRPATPRAAAILQSDEANLRIRGSKKPVPSGE